MPGFFSAALQTILPIAVICIIVASISGAAYGIRH